MATIPLQLTSDDSNTWLRLGFFVTWPGLGLFETGQDTTLVDLDGGARGYFRIKRAANGHLVAEASVTGTQVGLDLTPAMHLYAGSWYWVSAVMAAQFGVHGIWLAGKATGPGGTTDGLQAGSHAAASQSGTTNCQLGWGVSLSSFYAEPGVHAGWTMAQLVIDQGGSGDIPPWATIDWPAPDTDIDPAHVTPGTRFVHPTALYLCHEAVGSTTGLADSSGNHYDLTPGHQGLLVITPGPF